MSDSSTELADHLDSFSALTKAKAFLGREFLTWLWATAETTKNTIKITDATGGEHDTHIWIDDRIVMESTGGGVQANIMKGGDPSKSDEAVAALKAGKSVRELKLGLHIPGEGDFTAVLSSDGLSAAGLSPKSLQLPPPEEGVDEPILSRRLRLTGLFLASLDSLFAKFIGERSSRSWDKKGWQELQNWIREKGDAKVLH